LPSQHHAQELLEQAFYQQQDQRFEDLQSTGM
jgi:hypothetical protein